mmetsp:Transcript_19030/g.30785  ORF Transcript_19030/g.30785 Transcript_19030/m.30785 type:complete len:96 (+) Transcript_19030:233-520(+)
MWRDRFLAQHSALLYYVVLLGLWLVSPALAYNFSELIEAHAVDTYAQFAEQNKAALRLLPAPRIAKVLIGHNWPRRTLRHVSPNLRSRVESVLLG